MTEEPATPGRHRLLRPLLRAAFLTDRARRSIFQPVTLGVRVALVSDGRVVLVEHTYRKGWFLPGGGVKRNESLQRAARREAHEEAGATLGELKLLGIYSNFKEARSDHVVVFTCDDFTLDGVHDAEIARVQAFPLDDLPPSLSAGTARRLAEYLSGAPPRAGRW